MNGSLWLLVLSRCWVRQVVVSRPLFYGGFAHENASKKTLMVLIRDGWRAFLLGDDILISDRIRKRRYAYLRPIHRTPTSPREPTSSLQ